MDNKEMVILAGKQGGGGGGGGEVTPASVALAISRMTDAQAAQALADLGYEIDSILDSGSRNPVQNRALALAFLAARDELDSKADKPIVVEIDSTTPTITPANNHKYNCRTLDSLTITGPTAQGAYSIVFTSGSTPTQIIIPPAPAMRWQTADNEPPQGFPAANVRYEINVEDTYVTLGEWPVPGVST